jgi:hypothetical protein
MSNIHTDYSLMMKVSSEMQRALDEIYYLREEVKRLRDVEREYMDIVNKTIEHNDMMSRNILNLAMRNIHKPQEE